MKVMTTAIIGTSNHTDKKHSPVGTLRRGVLALSFFGLCAMSLIGCGDGFEEGLSTEGTEQSLSVQKPDQDGAAEEIGIGHGNEVQSRPTPIVSRGEAIGTFSAPASGKLNTLLELDGGQVTFEVTVEKSPTKTLHIEIDVVDEDGAEILTGTMRTPLESMSSKDFISEAKSTLTIDGVAIAFTDQAPYLKAISRSFTGSPKLVKIDLSKSRGVPSRSARSAEANFTAGSIDADLNARGCGWKLAWALTACTGSVGALASALAACIGSAGTACGPALAGAIAAGGACGSAVQTWYCCEWPENCQDENDANKPADKRSRHGCSPR